jgi:hypothetical protein
MPSLLARILKKVQECVDEQVAAADKQERMFSTLIQIVRSVRGMIIRNPSS